MKTTTVKKSLLVFTSFITILGVPAIFFVFLSGCAKVTNTDKVSDAQTCLDSATAATAQSCVDKVAGIETAGAYQIRCIGAFMADGFDDPSRLSSAISNLNSGSGSNQSIALMATLAFSASSDAQVNSTNAQTAFSYCQQSGSKGLIMLSSLTSMATAINAAAAAASVSAAACATDPNPTACQLTAAITFLADPSNANPTTNALIGAAATSAFQSNCTNGQTGNGSFCTQFSSAITQSGGDSQALGAQILTCYNDHAAAGCTGF